MLCYPCQGWFSSTLMHRVLCAAGARSLSVPWWLDQFTAPSKGAAAFSGLVRLRSSSCTTSSIVTNRSRNSSSVEVRLDLGTSIGRITDCNCDDDRDRRRHEQGRLPDVLQQPQVGCSAPMWYGAPVGTAHTPREQNCPCNLSG